MTWVVLDQQRDVERRKGDREKFAASHYLWITD